MRGNDVMRLGILRTSCVDLVNRFFVAMVRVKADESNAFRRRSRQNACPKLTIIEAPDAGPGAPTYPATLT